jgi:hypothetical protein
LAAHFGTSLPGRTGAEGDGKSDNAFVQQEATDITFDELRKFVSIISRLTAVIQRLCHTPAAFREWMLEDYREIARKAMMKTPVA